MSKIQNIPITLEVLPGGRPENTIMRVSHVIPKPKFMLAKCINQCMTGQTDEIVALGCPCWFDQKFEVGYSFIVGDVSAVDSKNFDMKCT